ncbi:Holliday junction resolvase [Phaeobacter italicus]|uniref:Holliday junction resolvase n=1 Tax=Phaeobacter italicus TaxID=481446 RepID=A0A0H5CZJ2_9RHOB|nr:Holliday junction resolvase [Phaeobacter italicus]
MRILGIDPGLRNLGWGVIESRGTRLSHVANGVCTSDGDDLHPPVPCRKRCLHL